MGLKIIRKLAIIVPSLGVGGMEVMTLQKIGLLTANGYDVYLIILSDETNLISQVQLQGKNILCLGLPNHRYITKGILNGIFNTVKKIDKFLNHNQIKLVIASLPIAHFVARLVFVLSLLSLRKLTIISYHHSIIITGNGVHKSYLEKAFNRINYFLAILADSGNIFISHAVREDILKRRFVRNGIVLHNLVNEVKSQSQIEGKYIDNFPLDDSYLVVVPGRLHPIKGHMFLINAILKLRDSPIWNNNRLTFIFAGGGEMHKELQTTIEEVGLESRIKITGVLNHDQILSLMLKANLIVIPSFFEGLGNVAIEAIMLRKVVLSSDSGGLKEVIIDGKTGFTFKMGNVDELNQRIKDIVLGRIIINTEMAYQHYFNNFSPETYFKKLHHYLEGFRG